MTDLSLATFHLPLIAANAETISWIALGTNAVLVVAVTWIGYIVSDLRGLRNRVEVAAKEPIEIRFGAMQAEQKAASSMIQQTLAAIGHRLENGDAKFDAISDRMQRGQIETITRVNELKDEVMNRMVSREECARLHAANAAAAAAAAKN